MGEIIATQCTVGAEADLDRLRRRRSPDDPWDGPTRADSILVARHDGRVLYRFNVPAMRAYLPVSRIPDLVLEASEASGGIVVRAVPDASRFDVPSLSVGLAHPLAEADVERFAALGGRVEHRLEVIDALSGVLPDRSVPTLRSHEGALWVETTTVACLTQGRPDPA